MIVLVSLLWLAVVCIEDAYLPVNTKYLWSVAPELENIDLQWARSPPGGLWRYCRWAVQLSTHLSINEMAPMKWIIAGNSRWLVCDIAHYCDLTLITLYWNLYSTSGGSHNTCIATHAYAYDWLAFKFTANSLLLFMFFLKKIKYSRMASLVFWWEWRFKIGWAPGDCLVGRSICSSAVTHIWNHPLQI